MALAYTLTIDGSILTAPVTPVRSLEVNSILDVPSTQVDDVINPATDEAVAKNPANVDTNFTNTRTYTRNDAGSSRAGMTSTTEASIGDIDDTEIAIVNVLDADAAPLPATYDDYSELTSFSLVGMLLYEQGAIAPTTSNDENINEFLLNAGTPFDATSETGELNLVSNTALYSYLGLTTPDADTDVVNLSATVDPITGMETVSITFDPDVAAEADFNVFYPFISMAAYDPANTIEVTSGEIVLNFSPDDLTVEGSINVLGTDGTTNYLYTAELSGPAVSTYVGWAESGPPITS